jgi:hypothetical protein
VSPANAGKLYNNPSVTNELNMIDYRLSADAACIPFVGRPSKSAS